MLLDAQGVTCRQPAQVLGDAPCAVEYWVRAYSRAGLAGLRAGVRPGRPPRQPPEQCGITANLWDGKVLVAFLRREFSVVLACGSASGCSRPWASGSAIPYRRSRMPTLHVSRRIRHKKGSRR